MSDDLYLLSERVKAYVPKIPSQKVPIFPIEGIEIIEKGKKKFISVVEGENYDRREIKNFFEVEWKTEIRGEGIVQIPTLRTYDGSSCGSVSIDIPSLVLEKLGFTEEIKVELSEPIVRLPIPEWVTQVTDWTGDYPNCQIFVKYCFASEAEGMSLKFRRELEKGEANILGDEYSGNPEQFVLDKKKEEILEVYKKGLEEYYSSGACNWGETLEMGRVWALEDSLKILGVSQKELNRLTHEAAKKYGRDVQIVEINLQDEISTEEKKKSFFSDLIGGLRKMIKVKGR